MNYKVYFVDGSIYQNDNFFEKLDWKLVPDKQIKKIEYLLSASPIILENLDKYIIFSEYTTDIYGSFKIASRLRNIYVMGYKDNLVSAYKINIKLANRKYEYGNVEKYECPKGKEFYGRPILKGWKGGE